MSLATYQVVQGACDQVQAILVKGLGIKEDLAEDLTDAIKDLAEAVLADDRSERDAAADY